MILRADARQLPLRDGCVQMVVTSPPYFGLRDYGTASWVGGEATCGHVEMASGMSEKNTLGPTGYLPPSNAANVGRVRQYKATCGKCGAQRVDAQIGLEATPDAYLQTLVAVFREVRRVLKDDGTCWVNMGDSYAGSGRGAQGESGAMASRSVGAARWRPSDMTGGLEGGRFTKTQQNRNGLMAVEGAKPKDLIGIPWLLAFALRADGWYLRSDIIWHKPNPMPESVTDRPTKAHEYLFLLSKQASYYYDADAIREPQTGNTHSRGHGSSPKGKLAQAGNRSNDSFHVATAEWHVAPDACRNKRSVWTVPTMPYNGAHFATMPEALVEPCILAGCPLGGLVLDPFLGSGTVGAVAERLGRRWVGTDLSYQPLSVARTRQRGLRFAGDVA